MEAILGVQCMLPPMLARSLALAGALALACQTPAASPPAPLPAVEPTPTAPASAAPTPVEDAGAPAPVADEPDAGFDAAPAPSCVPVGSPPVIDVRLVYLTRNEKMGDMPVSVMVAKVSAPAARLSHEIWSSPAPTGCSARVEGDELAFSCITDEGQIEGRARIWGEELLVETASGMPPMPRPFVVDASAPPPRTLTRVASAKVPCGATLRAHASSRSY